MTSSLGYFEQIPVVNLSLKDAEAASALRHACEKFGFFYGTLKVLICSEYCLSQKVCMSPSLPIVLYQAVHNSNTCRKC